MRLGLSAIMTTLQRWTSSISVLPAPLYLLAKAYDELYDSQTVYNKQYDAILKASSTRLTKESSHSISSGVNSIVTSNSAAPASPVRASNRTTVDFLFGIGTRIRSSSSAGNTPTSTPNFNADFRDDGAGKLSFAPRAPAPAPANIRPDNKTAQELLNELTNHVKSRYIFDSTTNSSMSHAIGVTEMSSSKLRLKDLEPYLINPQIIYSFKAPESPTPASTTELDADNQNHNRENDEKSITDLKSPHNCNGDHSASDKDGLNDGSSADNIFNFIHLLSLENTSLGPVIIPGAKLCQYDDIVKALEASIGSSLRSVL
jgi:hypothetical protein